MTGSRHLQKRLNIEPVFILLLYVFGFRIIVNASSSIALNRYNQQTTYGMKRDGAEGEENPFKYILQETRMNLIKQYTIIVRLAQIGLVCFACVYVRLLMRYRVEKLTAFSLSVNVLIFFCTSVLYISYFMFNLLNRASRRVNAKTSPNSKWSHIFRFFIEYKKNI